MRSDKPTNKAKREPWISRDNISPPCCGGSVTTTPKYLPRSQHDITYQNGNRRSKFARISKGATSKTYAAPLFFHRRLFVKTHLPCHNLHDSVSFRVFDNLKNFHFATACAVDKHVVLPTVTLALELPARIQLAIAFRNATSSVCYR